jgi:cytochrome c-type biogenesis protein
MEVYVGAFVAGIAATVTPCILPLYPAFLAYLTTSTALTPQAADAGLVSHRPAPAMAALLVWSGVVTGMLIIGGLIAALAVPSGDFNRLVLPMADLLLIGLGVLLLIGVNPFVRLPQLSPRLPGGGGAAVGAFSYGLLFAPIATPCSGPFLVGIFAFSLTIGDALGRLLFFAVFGIGFGLPLFVLGTVGQARGAELARAVLRHERTLQLVLGVALVAIGAWDLATSLPFILA